MNEHTFTVSVHAAAHPDRLFAVLADAPRWREWAGPSVKDSTWLRQGAPEPGGVGAVRRLGAWPLHTVETITEYAPPTRMSWTVRGLPVRDYACTVVLSPAVTGGTDIAWSGRFRGLRMFVPLLSGAVRGFATALAATPAVEPAVDTETRR